MLYKHADEAPSELGALCPQKDSVHGRWNVDFKVVFIFPRWKL